MNVVEWDSPGRHELARGGFVVGVLHREVHVRVAAHGADHVAHRLGGREPGFVLVGRPHHPHRLVALVLPWERPAPGIAAERHGRVSASGAT